MLYSTVNIEAIASGDMSFVKSIVCIFIETSSNCITELKKGIANNDGQIIKFNAHQLKPSIDLLEIKEGKQLVRDLECESVAESVNFKELEIKVDSFSTVLEAVIKALKIDFEL